MRAFERTHPWITFSLDLDGASPPLWMLLGEAQSKCEHLAGVPLRPSVQEKLYRIYLAKGAFATTSIEGNTLSEEEVRQRLEGRLELPRSREYLGREVDNVIKACNEIAASVLDSPSPLSVERIREFNRLVLEGLEHGEGVVPGETRKHSVGVADYRGAPAEDCDYLLGRMCDWLNSLDHPILTPVVKGLLKSVLAHLYIAWIHPFGDGNGRTARLVEFQLLLEARVPFPAAHLLSNHYNKTRTKYYRELSATSKSGGKVLPFLRYAVEGFVDGLREHLKEVREEQLAVAWENYVHERFPHPRPADQRQRLLALELSRQQEPAPTSRIRQLSPALAEAYATKTSKTVNRDLNNLIRLGLAEKVSAGYRTRQEIMLAFLPPRARSGGSGKSGEKSKGRK